MSSIIKKTFWTLLLATSLSSCLIQNAQPEDCEQIEIVVMDISEGASKDIVFTDTNGDTYYVNRGLEHGLELDLLKTDLVDKKVNLHLYTFWFGTTDHISQVTKDKQVIFTEFK